VLDAAVALLAPNGELRIVDFGRQEGLPGVFRRLLRRWLALFHFTPRDELEGALAACAAANGAAFVLQRAYRGYAQYAVVRQAAA
jgi:S-adenosylmethionine-diacylgycerolhomoserine-N-methlytransferase